MDVQVFRRWLYRCDIPISLDLDRNGEIYGQIGNLVVRNSHNYYCMINGYVDYRDANLLYQDCVGKTDIRVCGHCGCPSPDDPWLTYFGNNKQILLMKDKIECERYLKYEGSLRKIAKNILNTSLFSDERKDIAEYIVVNGYHIDSELGLYKFKEQIRWTTLLPKLPKT